MAAVPPLLPKTTICHRILFLPFLADLDIPLGFHLTHKNIQTQMAKKNIIFLKYVKCQMQKLMEFF